MGHDTTDDTPLAIHVDAEGTIWIDAGSRLVPLDDPEELERILDRVADERRSVRLAVDPGHADDEDEAAVRGSGATDEAVAYVLGRLTERAIAASVEEVGDR